MNQSKPSFQTSNHPSREKLRQYRFDNNRQPPPLNGLERVKIALHLKECETCRAQIPPFTITDLRHALDGATENQAFYEAEAKSLSQVSFENDSPSSIARQQKRGYFLPLAASTAAVLLLAALILNFGAIIKSKTVAEENSRQDNQLAALNDENQYEKPEILNVESENGIEDRAANNPPKIEAKLKNPVQVKSNTKLTRHSLEPKQSSPGENQTKQARPGRSTINGTHKLELPYSESRSLPEANLRINAKAVCLNLTANLLNLETLVDETPTFRWQSIPQAVKYHLYLSDLDLNLIDEFETESETSYQTKTQLKPNTIYQWRMIATLKTGQSLILEPVRFSINQPDKNQKKILKKQINQLRCLSD